MSNTVSAAATVLPTRRRALASLASLGAAVALPVVAQAMTAHDPIPALYAERKRAMALLDECQNDAEADPLMDVWGACDRAAIASPATTLAGAAVSLEWARAEYVQFTLQDGEKVPDQGERLILALLDGALAVLRKQGGAS